MVSRHVLFAAFLLFASQQTMASGDSSHCISFDTTSNSIASFLVNRCSYKVIVSWEDHDHCSNGCSGTVGPNSKESITPLKMHSKKHHGACKYPGIPTLKGYGLYECK